MQIVGYKQTFLPSNLLRNEQLGLIDWKSPLLFTQSLRFYKILPFTHIVHLFENDPSMHCFWIDMHSGQTFLRKSIKVSYGKFQVICYWSSTKGWKAKKCTAPLFASLKCNFLSRSITGHAITKSKNIEES